MRCAGRATARHRQMGEGEIKGSRGGGGPAGRERVRFGGARTRRYSYIARPAQRSSSGGGARRCLRCILSLLRTAARAPSRHRQQRGGGGGGGVSFLCFGWNPALSLSLAPRSSIFFPPPPPPPARIYNTQERLLRIPTSPLYSAALRACASAFIYNTQRSRAGARRATDERVRERGGGGVL